MTPTDTQLKDPRTLTQRQARVAWTLLAEPGDTMANVVICDYDGDAAAALANVVDGGLVGEGEPDLEAALLRWRPRISMDRFAAAIQQTIRLGITVVIPGDKEWPTAKFERLGDDAPLALYVLGDAALLNYDEPAVAVVGARAATGYGEHCAMEITAGLVAQDVTIVSGAAYGIDGMAHRAALANRGRTIAVLAGGVDRFYPAGHDALLARIVEAGAVVSELPPGSPPTKWRFLQRNRIIAALSDAVLVVEAGYRSGSLNTASHAVALGIPIGAVPGPVTSAASAGCHRLLREGLATCVTSTDEAFELLAEQGDTEAVQA